MRTDWAEEDDDDSLALPAPQIIKNKDGTETTITYSIRDDGKKVKTTRRIKRTTVRTVVNPRVAERRAWTKFGQEAGKGVGPQNDTTSVGENIVLRLVQGYKAGAQEDKKAAEEAAKKSLKDAKIKCRICSGDHWTTKCPWKDTMAPEGEAGTNLGSDAGGEGVDAEGRLGTGSGGYVPPHLRKGGAASGERMGGKYERDDLATLRVTNVCFFLPCFAPLCVAISKLLCANLRV